MNLKMRNAIVAGLLATGAGVAAPAHANSEAMFELINILRQNGTIDQATYESLMKVAREDAEQSEEKVKKVAKAEARKASKGSVKVSTKGGHLKFKSQDGDFKFQIGGRIMADYAFYNEDSSELGSGAEIRRARLFMKGTLFRNWHFKNQFDFAGNKVKAKDNYIRYTGLKPGGLPLAITLGHFKEFSTLEDATSSKYITFMERASAVEAFAGGREIGLGLSTHGDFWTVAAGVFDRNLGSDSSASGSEGDDGWDFSFRGTVAPWHEKTRNLHLGGWYRHTWVSDFNRNVRVRERPESHVTGVRFVNTGNFSSVDDVDAWGLEAAAVYGPFSAQAEYLAANYNRSGGNQDVNLDGWYAYASYFLTGESRSYKPNKGGFGRVHPASVVGKGGWGAWEVAVRYSTIDLTDGPGILGGQEDNITLGLNWYATPTVRFMANYIFVDNDRNATGNMANSTLAAPAVYNAAADDPEIFQLRAQIDF